MSSYLSSLLTSTTSRYNTLRRTLLSNEDDGDTEDDSHISRVLRAYYTEKARPCPPWLPPDPNDRRALTPQPYPAAGAQQGQQQQGAGGGGGGYFPSARNQPQYSAPQNAGGQRGSLSDLWDPPATSASPTPPMQPQSLRAGVRRGLQPSSRPSSTLAPPPVQARPLPSQRAGSQQNVGAQVGQYVPAGQGVVGYAAPLQQGARGGGMGMEGSPPGSSSGGAGGGTAQDRLKARLWGGQRAGSSTSVGSASNAGGSAGGGLGSGGAGAAGNPYGTSANAPWSSNGGDGYGGFDGGGRNPYDTGGAGGQGGQGGGANNRRYGRTG
ncbi:hypothetical protein LTR57_019455 [Friedmanniomyces endolithicus]|nr:hypothetical protein LTR57_019455 [Friedmanniomyces endolithicus]